VSGTACARPREPSARVKIKVDDEPTILAATIDENVGGISGVFGNCYDVIIAAAAARAAKRAPSAHGEMEVSGVRAARCSRWRASR
jgi:hypothetical protein